MQLLPTTWWKRVLNVENFYMKKIQSLALGRVLEIGSGIGRNLVWLNDSVGVDHNEHSVAVAKERGLNSYTNKEFHKSKWATNGYFDSLIFVHVMEHLLVSEADMLLGEFRKYLKPHGRLLIICPQEKGFRSDETHICFFDFGLAETLGVKNKFGVVTQKSFPLPRLAGKIFRGNEFISVFTSTI